MRDQHQPGDVHRVAVLGFGTMGAGIAQVVAVSGRSVTVLESSADRVTAGMAALRALLDGAVRRGKLTEGQSDDVAKRVRAITDPGELGPTDLVIEAVTEKFEVKTAVLAAAAAAAGKDAIIVTNTSALSVTELARSVSNEARFAGLHFFNPAPAMKLVEVVCALQTAEQTAGRLVEFARSLGKEPIVVKDRPGFLVNRLLMPYLNDVIQAYDEQLASAEDIDVALRLGLGYKLGPLELLDLIGLDSHEHSTTSAYNATRDPVFAPPPLLRAMVAAGYHGTKSGRGFRAGG